ncbi:hypothetical protein NVP1123O_62 [Vibrio phage 1.123.O._10N.286.48.F3]|nr:hypothetical protein NVP1123O_62 [Vibrio phage 1.123.O._10N.286.48.F3]
MIRTEPFTGTLSVSLGSETAKRWHEISAVLLVNGTPVESGLSGNVSARARVIGTVDWTEFQEELNLSQTTSWAPFLSGIYELEFTASGLPANGEVVMTINNWSQS